jgi:hypothetical protein
MKKYKTQEENVVGNKDNCQKKLEGMYWKIKRNETNYAGNFLYYEYG